MYRNLDLYCGAGGISKGYADAGFEVVGVDLHPQKHYPYQFHQQDALEYLAAHYMEFDAVHASPPCQEYSMASKQFRLAGKVYSDLIASTRDALVKTGKPYVIENVPGAPLINPIILTGAMFGMPIKRDRLFECSFHVEQPPMVFQKSAIKMGRRPKEGDVVWPVGHFSGVPYVKRHMGIDWMTQKELAQAIPPVFSEYIGGYLLKYLTA